MALRDASCYTLTAEPSRENPAILELKENNGEVRYARVREKVNGEAYATALYGMDVHLRGVSYTQMSRADNSNKYKWKRDLVGKDMVCSLDRKPEPSVEVCLAREGDKRDFPRISILHYNIERFQDIKDLRGLEYLLVMSVLCLMDAAEERQAERAQSTGLLRTPSGSKPAVPAKPSPPTSSSSHEPQRIITPEDFEPEESNEIIVGMQTDINTHIDRALALLCDPGILYIVIRTKRPEAAQRAMQVCSGITRARHRNGEPELHQYVNEEQPPAPRGPRVINLDDPKPEPWRPPLLAIYLSTIELPDLAPGRREAQSSPPGVVRHPTKGKATPVLIAPQPKRPNGHTAPHGLPNVRLSPSPEPSKTAQHVSHGKHPSHGGKPSQQSPPVPPAPSFGAPQPSSTNGKLTKPNGANGGSGVKISRLFKGRA
ncbi:hypothetical protein A1Q2_02155 [Trichosporon asahii var. asahii CBS 8904]|uniref:Uncharacterized protein n=1 Tax=Trichosporon asahii var. asahii (strain CBS 8904) TaxID=1220162 RepID=K1VVS6_TRIAC|nr:hypothetical protein A1Q2_02155 [Trichosporon asahii var. asahii CBS 8904]